MSTIEQSIAPPDPVAPDVRDKDSGRVVVRGLTKRFGSCEAVRDLSFTVEPGQVTGFLGPNGAGKTTTLRAVLGLVLPTEGSATVNGVRYRELPHPARVVGAVLDAECFDRRRKARTHLRICADAIGVPRTRVAEVLAVVGLGEVAYRRIGGFSTGMRQRLALATALLGDPRVLILDEPGSGFDPEGVAWLRRFVRSFAASGGTVLVSSHQLAEIAQTVDRVVIISKGRQVYDGLLEEREAVRVRCTDPTLLVAALARHDLTDVDTTPDGALTVRGATTTAVGEAALEAGVVLHELTRAHTDLEQQFLALTVSEYQPDTPAGRAVQPSTAQPEGAR